MKSFIYAALFAAVLAVPTKYGSDACKCDVTVMCAKIFPEPCDCITRRQTECAKILPKHCPVPELPARCMAQEGGNGDDKECGKNKPCEKSLVCSYEGVFPYSSESSKGKCVKKTDTINQTCGTRGAAPCPDGYKCFSKADPKKVADAPGKCVINDSKPTPTGYSTSAKPTTPTSTSTKPSTTCTSSATTSKPILTPITKPTAQPTDKPERCGGFPGKKCDAGFECSYAGNPPNVADYPGKCVPISKSSSTSGVYSAIKTSSAVDTKPPTQTSKTTLPGNVKPTMYAGTY